MKGLLTKKWDLAVAKSRKMVYWKPIQYTWPQLVERLKQTKYTDETYEQYEKLPKAEQDEVKDVGGFVGGVLRNGKRQKGQILSRELICLDADFAPLNLWEIVTNTCEFTCCLYSTHKHSEKRPRYRLVIPLSRPVSEEEYPAVARKVASWIGIESFDETTYEAERLMYWPSTSLDGLFVCEHQEGPWLEVDQVLGDYIDWRDCENWPRSQRNVQGIKSERKRLGSPTDKPGVIGAFCRGYGMCEAIAIFLSEVYEVCETTQEGRYTYKQGSTTGGAIVYENQYMYSHHGTDPAGGRCQNAFDLVRIHLFGHLDEGGKAQEIVTKRPSYNAMIKWASEDPKVRINLLEEVRTEFMEQVPLVKEEKECKEEKESKEEQESKRMNYLYISESGKTCVNTSFLAQYIREHCHYKVVRKQGYELEMLYWYEEGYYQLISHNEFRGYIKKFIPQSIRRPVQWEDTYKELLTDRTPYDLEDMDQDKHLINVKNGLYNLKTKSLEGHTPERLTTIQLACSYNPLAPKPTTWLEFIERLTKGDAQLAAILQEWFGLTLSNMPGHRTKKCLGLVGVIGNTGKTQYNNMLAYLIGSQNICATPIQDYEKNFGMGNLYGAKAILIDDQSSIAIKDSSNFKKLTGGGLINCEMKGKQGFPYIFKGTLTFGCNDLPYFNDDKGDHLFERFIVIPCNNVIPKAERKGNILESFKKEADGIFIWALEGLHRLRDQNYQFTYSKQSEALLKEYIGMNDSFYRFLSEGYRVTGEANDRVLKKTLDEAYFTWAKEQDIEPIKRRNLMKRAAKHGIGVKKSSSIYYVGLRAVRGMEG